ncbi:MAG: PilT/PilU family type 4a pilus ATPase [Prochlorotrichaceae cyanobacterium]
MTNAANRPSVPPMPPRPTPPPSMDETAPIAPPPPRAGKPEIPRPGVGMSAPPAPPAPPRPGMVPPSRPPIPGNPAAPPTSLRPPSSPGIPSAPPGMVMPPSIPSIPSTPGRLTPSGSRGMAPEGPSPGQPTLFEVVKRAYDSGISDIHAGVGEPPRYRDRGEIMETDYPETDLPTFMSWLKEIMSDEEIRRFQDTLDFDGATQYEFARARINVFDALKGPSLVIRLIPLKILTLEQLKCPPVFKDLCHYHKGLILVTGPTGSGKSTTMAAMIDYINREMPKHIITIEDPIEFVHQSKKSLVKHREVGMHTLKFENALKASLREDPDLILVGEIRDQETIKTALKAAQTGHLVMGTLHTNSAVKTIERILNMFSPAEQDPIRIAVAESLIGIVAQGLCRTTDGKRAAFHEIMLNTDAIKDYIRRNEVEEIEAIIPRCTFDGMATMNQSLYRLYEEGRITEETALECSPKPNEMAQMLRGRV